jgi:hypothetical protein
MSGLCRPLCSLSGRLAPQYRFVSEDTRVGDFVQPSPADPTLPYLDEQGNLGPDETSGLFCGVGAGQTFVSLISGFRRVRALVTVGGGFGPCVKRVIPALPHSPEEPQPRTGPAGEQPQPPFRRAFFRFDRRLQVTPILPPPPISVAAPAPPGAPGIGRKEEHEVQHQESGQKHFLALSRARYRQDAQTGAWLALGAAVLMAVAGATAAAHAVQRRPEFVRARAGRDRR